MAEHKKRGFATMNPEKRRAIAQQGGRAAHEKGVAHEFSREEAQKAGERGGLVVSQNRAHMAEIGRKGARSATRGALSTTDEPVTTPKEQHSPQSDTVSRSEWGNNAEVDSETVL